MADNDGGKELYELIDSLWDIIPESYDEKFAYLVRWLIRADDDEREVVVRWLKTWRYADD